MDAGTGATPTGTCASCSSCATDSYASIEAQFEDGRSLESLIGAQGYRVERVYGDPSPGILRAHVGSGLLQPVFVIRA